MDLFKIIFLAIFVNNVALTQFLGIRIMLGESNNISSSLRMGGIIMFLLILVNFVNYFILKYFLIPLQIQFLQLIIFILLIILISHIIEFLFRKTNSKLFKKFTDYFSQITTSSIVLGVCLLTFKNNIAFNLIQNLIYTISATVGYTLALLVMTGITDQLELTRTPEGMKGIPISLITIGLLSLAFMGLTGVIK
jgi:electron transport complex protein RnfA